MSTMRKVFRATPVAVMVSLVAACTASPASPPTADASQMPSMAATSSPTAIPAPTPTPMPSPAECTADPTPTAVGGDPSSAPSTAETLLSRPGPLEPGRYKTTQFEPQIALTLGSGWNLLFADDYDELAFDRIGKTSFLGFGRVNRVVNAATGRDEEAPSDLIAWLSQHNALTDKCTTQAAVGGLPARIVEATASRTADMFFYPTGSFHVTAGSRFRWYVLTVDGQELVVTVAAPVDAFDSLITDVEPVLDSLEVLP